MLGKSKSGKAEFFAKAIVLALVVLTSTGIVIKSRTANNKNLSTLSNIPTKGQATDPDITQSIQAPEPPDWKTYSSADDPLFSSGNPDFSFQFPSGLLSDHADGPEGSYAEFFTGDFELSVKSIDSGVSSSDMALEYVNTTKTKVKTVQTCEIFPKLCDDKNYSVFSEKLPNGLVADVARGPSSENEIFENYFITLRDMHTLNMNFTFKDTEDWRTVKQQILSSLQLSSKP